jgi:hypothetical protein
VKSLSFGKKSFIRWKVFHLVHWLKAALDKA